MIMHDNQEKSNISNTIYIVTESNFYNCIRHETWTQSGAQLAWHVVNNTHSIHASITLLLVPRTGTSL